MPNWWVIEKESGLWISHAEFEPDNAVGGPYPDQYAALEKLKLFERLELVRKPKVAGLVMLAWLALIGLGAVVISSGW